MTCDLCHVNNVYIDTASTLMYHDPRTTQGWAKSLCSECDLFVRVNLGHRILAQREKSHVLENMIYILVGMIAWSLIRWYVLGTL